MKDSQSLKKDQSTKVNKEVIVFKTDLIVPAANWFKRYLYLIRKIFSFNKEKKQSQGKKILHVFIKKYEIDIQLILIPLILLIVLIIISFCNNYILQDLAKNHVASVQSAKDVNPYPFVADVIAPTISAKAAIITDASSQKILYSKNSHLRFSMASTTKIMTAIAAMDYFQRDSILTIKSQGIEGSSLGLYSGQRFYFKDLLYAMLLPSANDAAYAIAENFPGGVEAFIAKMNTKAAQLHLGNTHFGDPAGLNDDEDYTTVVDMAHLASYAITKPEFIEITSTKEKVISDVDKTQVYYLNNLNKLLGSEGVYGIKTGTTEGAGEVLVTSTLVNGHTYILVVMNSQERFIDTKKLIEFISQNVQYIMPPLPVQRY